jgi:formate hydrogenlyase subunit 4
MYTIILLLVSSIFFVGILNKTRAIAGGRKGPGLLQPMKDLLRLLYKQTMYSHTTTFVYKIAPSIYLASLLTAILFISFGSFPALVSFPGDFIFFISLLAVGRFFMMLAALDTGSAFEGMGANREALYGMLVEPAFFLVVISFAMYTDNISFFEIYTQINYSKDFSWILATLASFILVQIMMVENGRLPVGDPRTHLELTMIHEVMILDYSGFDLAMIQYGASLKFSIYGMLIANFFLTNAMPGAIQVLVWAGIQILLAVLVGLQESFRARERMKKNPQFIFTLLAFSVLLFFGVLIWMQKLN